MFNPVLLSLCEQEKRFLVAETKNRKSILNFRNENGRS